MRALVFEGPDRLVLRDWPTPRPEPGGIVIRVMAAAICATDLRIVSGRKTRDVRIGHPIGHECAGIVAAVGDGVSGLGAGDRVSVCVVVSCGQCRWCRADRENLCTGRRTLGYHTDGCFADYMPVPRQAVERGNVFRLPDGLSFETAALLEPLACCLNGQRELGLTGSDSVVIFGAGPIGLLHMLLARQQGCRRVVMVEPRPLRRECALRMGATEALDPAGFRAVDEFDAAILAIGVPELLPRALAAVAPCGRVNLFAGFPAGAVAGIDPNLIHYKQLVVTGASESRRRDYADALDLVRSGRLDLAPLVTHRFDLSEHRTAFAVAADGSGLKVVFVGRTE